jgi:hypothetical protein
MVQRRLTGNEMHRLGPCQTALRILAKSTGPHRHVLVEKHIDGAFAVIIVGVIGVGLSFFD